MEETIVQTSDDVQFIEGVTRMNQENWQKYFRSVLENKILSGFDTSFSIIDKDISIGSGSVVANGIVGHFEFDGGAYMETLGDPSDALRDVLYCARLYFGSNRVELVKKTNIAESRSSSDYCEIINNLLLDESYLCERNDLYYELPIAYVKDGLYYPSGSAHSFNVINLYNRYSKDKFYESRTPMPARIYGSGVLFDNYIGAFDNRTEYLYLDFLNQVEDLYFLTNDTAGTVYILNIPYLNSDECSRYRNYQEATFFYLKKYVFHLKGTHLSQNSKMVTYSVSSTSGMKGFHIQKMYNYEQYIANDALAHYMITEVDA